MNNFLRQHILIFTVIILMLPTGLMAGWEGKEYVSNSYSPQVCKMFFDHIRNNLNDKHILENDLNCEGVVIEPIGSIKEPFTGSFDGRGHTIYNLTINSKQEHVGLFSFVCNEAEIKNLIFKKANISGGNNVGTVIGSASYLFEEGICYVFGNTKKWVTLKDVHVIDSKINGEENVGGVVGDIGFIMHVRGELSDIENVSVQGSTITANYMSAGGITGGISWTRLNSAKVVNTNISAQQVGGISATAGNNTLISKATVNNAKLDAKNHLAGGLVGYFKPMDSIYKGSINNSYAKTVIENAARSTGGLVGTLEYVDIDTSAAEIDIIIKSRSDTIGGLIGEASFANIKNSYSMGKIVDKSALLNLSGGLIGYLKQAVRISNTYSVTEMKTQSNWHVGALIGSARNSLVERSFWNPIDSGMNQSPGGGTEATQAQMQSQKFYENNNQWDFENIWYMEGYPRLQWQRNTK